MTKRALKNLVMVKQIVMTKTLIRVKKMKMSVISPLNLFAKESRRFIMIEYSVVVAG
jgi:hypothetical protein